MSDSPSDFPDEQDDAGQFVRQESAFRRAIGDSDFPAAAGRYHLYVSLACPWAHRTMIVRRLKGLERAISLSVVDPIRDARGWAFREGRGHGPDPINGFRFLAEAYAATDPRWDGRVTVPVLWDRERGEIVNNESAEIIVMLNDAFGEWASGPDLYPEALRPEIDALNARVYDDVNNGVYRAGFATTQGAYEQAVRPLFATLADLEERLADRRWLMGDDLTLADIRLFTTLIRFDVVYVSHFKCAVARIVDHPNLWRYTRDLYSQPGVAETVDLDHIKRHYFMTHTSLNPTRIVPVGPELDYSLAG